MAYYYWKTKGISPMTFYKMGKHELKVIQAFYEVEIQDRNDSLDTGNVFPIVHI